MPLGPGADIPPWNFPCAILAGMAAAALVGGNTVAPIVEEAGGGRDRSGPGGSIPEGGGVYFRIFIFMNISPVRSLG